MSRAPKVGSEQSEFPYEAPRGRHPLLPLGVIMVVVAMLYVSVTYRWKCASYNRAREAFVLDGKGGVVADTPHTHIDARCKPGVGGKLSHCYYGGSRCLSGDLTGANLRGAYIGCITSSVNFHRDSSRRRENEASLDGAVFEPTYLDSLPPAQNFLGAHGLQGLLFLNGPEALFALRKKFVDAGRDDHVRALTEAILRARACDNAYGFFLTDPRVNFPTRVIRHFEAFVNISFLDVPSEYGSSRTLPLWILIASLFVFAAVYMLAVVKPHQETEDTRRAASKRLDWLRKHGSIVVVYRQDGQQKRGALWTAAWTRAYANALHFSLLTAFRIGWGEWRIASWLEGLEREPIALRGRGWVRQVAGIQTILSLYLLVLFITSMFPNPLTL